VIKLCGPLLADDLRSVRQSVHKRRGTEIITLKDLHIGNMMEVSPFSLIRAGDAATALLKEVQVSVELRLARPGST
jgi:hypothetical protein